MEQENNWFKFYYASYYKKSTGELPKALRR